MATLQRIAHLLRPIRVRLTLWYVALLMVILATFSAFLYVRLAQNLARRDGSCAGVGSPAR